MTTKLSHFTDILGDVDEICDSQVSQPLSFPSSAESRSQIIRECSETSKLVRPAKGTGQYNELRSVEEIDPKYRDVFIYPYFNLIQSRVIEDALYSDKSMVVCAPTGSGKTVIFEMAIVQLLMEFEDKKNTEDYKIIYMAPVKALCTERLTEWYAKFTKLGLLCIEVTGDTDVDFLQLQAFKIIITTPEKWDMLTRRWRDHRALVEKIKLFLIDEVHILNDEMRGPVLEAVVSRMKTIQASAQSAYRIEKLKKQYNNMNENGVVNLLESEEDSPPRIRFVAVSATVSNPEDVAAWLGTGDKPAVYYKFGDESRPVKLKRVVEGYPCSDGTSIFKFDIILNYKLWPIIQRYHNGKPTLIFCNTRKSVLLTAETLSREITITFNPDQQAKLTALASSIKNKKLQSLVLGGVGCHHAGMLYEERTSIEQAFRNGDLPILITTTTLAMGVNLPAHLVIIKNTQQYVNGAYQEYSISTVLQMVGRAGRPQYDTEATAVIMTRQKDKARYQALAGGNEPLQSYLHKRLAENLNSETALGTVGDVAQCVEWLRSTFLYVRAAKDPRRYLGLTAAAPEHLILKKIEELCVIAMNGLSSAGLINMDEASCIASTEAGQLMSRYYLDLETMKQIMKIQGDETLDRLVWIICESHELSDMHLRTDERRTLNALNRNNNSPTIRFPMKGKITTKQMKLSCLIQAILGCLPIPDPSLNQEAMKIMRIADRICKCIVAYVTSPEKITSMQHQCFAAVLNSIVLAKCVTAHLWENSPFVSKQLKGIGPTFSTLLATAGKVNFMILEESHPRDLERIMNKGPPAGNVLRKQISLLPKYQLTATPVDENTITVKLQLLNQAFLSENMEHLTAGANHKCFVIAGDSTNHILMLKTFTDKDLVSVYDGTMNYEIIRKHDSEHKVFIHCISSDFAGLDVQCEYTFKNLIPTTPRAASLSSDYFSEVDAIKNKSNTTTERKRRNLNEAIIESKEKKKRDNALSERIKLLKESFGRTSNNLKKDLQKAKEISNNVICDLTQSNKPSKNTELEIRDEVNFNLNQIPVTFDPISHFQDDNINDFIDDSRIDSILNDIETEITKANVITTQDVSLKNKELHSVLSKSYKNKTNVAIEPCNIPVYSHFSERKSSNKHPKSRSNYKCLELADKNMDFSDEEITMQKKSGFSEAIKTQIDKYFVNSHKPPGILDLTLANLCSKNKKSVINKDDEDIYANDLISQQNPLQKDIDLDDKIENKDKSHEVAHTLGNIFSQENKINNEDNNNTAINFEDVNYIETPQVTEKNLLKPQTKENLYNDQNPSKSNISIVKNEEELISNTDNTDSPSVVHDEVVAFKLTNTESSPNLVGIKPIITSINRQLSFNLSSDVSKLPATNKDLKLSSICTPTAQSLIKNQESKLDNTNMQLPLVTANKTCSSNILSQMKLPSYRQVHENMADIKSLIPCLTNDTFPLVPSTEHDEISFIAPPLRYINKQSPVELPHTSQFRNRIFTNPYIKYKRASENNLITKPFPEVADVVAVNEENGLKPSYTGDNLAISLANDNQNWFSSDDSQFIENEKKEHEDKYLFSGEKVDIHTKITDDHKIQIIRRLKVDLDITKIVTKFERNDTANVQAQNCNLVQQSEVNGHDETCSGQILQKYDNLCPYTLDNKDVDPSLKHIKFEGAIKTNKTYSKSQVNLKQDKDTIEDEEKFENNSHKIAPEKDNNITNILQKYSEIIGKNKTCLPKVSLIQSSYGNNNTIIKPFKANRPFKITDLQNVDLPNAPLCEELTITPHVETSVLPEKLYNSNNRNNDMLPDSVINLATNQLKKDDKEYFVEPPSLYDQLTPCHSPTENLEHTLENGEDYFKIDQSMFNPKTLLQSLGNDADEIIPPPPEFDNDDIYYSYSPECKKNISAPMHYFAGTSPTSEEITIFEDNSQNDGDLTPIKETWVLSCDDDYESNLAPQITSLQSCTVTRNNQIIKNNFQGSRNSDKIIERKGRLSAFKFNRKTKFKK